MGDQSGGGSGSGSTLVEIAAARALQWNVDFDRGLRSPKHGAQCEAIMKLGPQLVRWSHDCDVTASSANLFKLEPGQDRVFANAILLRLAETFRSGNNFIRLCVLKALMLEVKGRGWIGERFIGDNFDRISLSKKYIPERGSRSRPLRKFGSGGTGLLTKKRIENHAEMLRRIKTVIGSGDPTSRALAIRVLGCLADLGKDSADVHNIVSKAVHSPHRLEVNAALFAMGCISELSDEFAGQSLQKAFEMINSMETSPEVKVLAIRLFSKVGNSSVLSLQAFEMGRRIMLRYPLHKIVTSMLVSLTILAAGSSVIVANQVDLLLAYIAGDPRMNIRAVALKCLSKLVPQALCGMEESDGVINGVFAVVQDMTLPSALHVLALRVLQKLFHHCVAIMEFAHLVQILSWVELAALSDVWPVTEQALSLLVDGVYYIRKYKLQGEPSEYTTELMELSLRTCFLLCDQVCVSCLVARRSRELRQLGSVSVMEEETMRLVKQKVLKVCVLLVKLVQASPSVGWQVIDSLAGVMDALTQQRKGNADGERSETITDQETNVDEKQGEQEEQADLANVEMESVKANGFHSEIKVLLTDMGRCLSSCASSAEYKPNMIEDIHRRLLQLVSVLVSVDTPYSVLMPTLQALMKAALAVDSLKTVAIYVGKGPEMEILIDGKIRGGQMSPRLLAQSRSTLHELASKIMQGRNFGICYEVGKQGALNALWDLADFIFDCLVDKVSSEGCYFWLKALSYLSKAEAVLQIGKDVEEGACKQMDASGRTDPPKGFQSGRDLENFKEKDPLNRSGTQNTSQVEETRLERFGKAAALAVPLLQNSISSLSAGVCLERMFEYQRSMLTVRLEVLDCVSELVGVLARISALDTEAGVIDLEDESKKNDMKSLGSALRASTEQIQVLASRLRNLSQEYDLLSISFMGMDQRSVGLLSRAALFCTLLTFCSAGMLPLQPSNSQLPVNLCINLGSVALDLFRRLEKTDGDWDGLLTFAIQSGSEGISGLGFGGTLAVGPLENAMVNLSRCVVNSVLGLQQQHTLLGVVRGIRLLQEILQECLNVPWPSPPFFFCTRPRTGVELFLAQAGAHTGETEGISVTQGSALALSVCLQVVHAPPESLLSVKRLVCGLSIQPAESTSKLIDDVHPVSKSGFVVNKPIRPAVVEQLILHSKMPTIPDHSPVWDGTASQDQAVTHKQTDSAPDLIFSVCLDSKGQGFASCTLNVSQLPAGEYHLTLSCICVDGKTGQWILPLLSAQPGFHII